MRFSPKFLLVAFLPLLLLTACSEGEKSYFNDKCPTTSFRPGDVCNPETYWKNNQPTAFTTQQRSTDDYQRLVDSYEREIFNNGGNICNGEDGWHPTAGGVWTGEKDGAGNRILEPNPNQRSVWVEHGAAPDSIRAPFNNDLPGPRCTEAAFENWTDKPTVDVEGPPFGEVDGWVTTRDVVVKWTSDGGVTSSRCSLQNLSSDFSEMSLRPCSPAYSLGSLPDGKYKFSVDVTDGYSYSAPASTLFNVDLTPPTPATFGAVPAKTLSVDNVEIAFAGGSDATSGVAGYYCLLDNEPIDCPVNKITLTQLNPGLHIFSVQVQDIAGNKSLPITTSFTYVEPIIPDPPDPADPPDPDDPADPADPAAPMGETGSKIVLPSGQKPVASRFVTVRALCTDDCQGTLTSTVAGLQITIKQKFNLKANKVKVLRVRFSSAQTKTLRRALQKMKKLLFSTTANFALVGDISDYYKAGLQIKK